MDNIQSIVEDSARVKMSPLQSKSMAQLFAWQHFRSTNVMNTQLPQLDSIMSEESPVSFVFQLFSDVKREETPVVVSE